MRVQPSWTVARYQSRVTLLLVAIVLHVQYQKVAQRLQAQITMSYLLSLALVDLLSSLHNLVR